MAFIKDKHGKRCHIGNWLRITISYSVNGADLESVFVDELSKICNEHSIEMKRRSLNGSGGLWIAQPNVKVEKLTEQQAMLALLEV